MLRLTHPDIATEASCVSVEQYEAIYRRAGWVIVDGEGSPVPSGHLPVDPVHPDLGRIAAEQRRVALAREAEEAAVSAALEAEAEFWSDVATVLAPAPKPIPKKRPTRRRTSAPKITTSGDAPNPSQED